MKLEYGIAPSLGQILISRDGRELPSKFRRLRFSLPDLERGTGMEKGGSGESRLGKPIDPPQKTILPWNCRMRFEGAPGKNDPNGLVGGTA